MGSNALTGVPQTICPNKSFHALEHLLTFTAPGKDVREGVGNLIHKG